MDHSRVTKILNTTINWNKEISLIKVKNNLHNWLGLRISFKCAKCKSIRIAIHYRLTNWKEKAFLCDHHFTTRMMHMNGANTITRKKVWHARELFLVITRSFFVHFHRIPESTHLSSRTLITRCRLYDNPMSCDQSISSAFYTYTRKLRICVKAHFVYFLPSVTKIMAC